MKFYHVCPKSSPGEQPVVVKKLFATFFLFVFLTGRNDACNFEGFNPVTSYTPSIESLRDNLPTDYNLTVFLQDMTGMDGCCSDLQTMLSLNRSIEHLIQNSVDPLRELALAVTRQIGFLGDCPVEESFNCEVKRWNSTHLLQNLKQSLNSFSDRLNREKCNLTKCVLYTCTPGQVTTTSEELLGISSSGASHTPTTTDVPTSLSSAMNLQSPLASTPPTFLTNGSNVVPSLRNGSLANGSQMYPATANGNTTNAPLSLTTNVLHNKSYPLSPSANTSIVNGTETSPVNISQPAVDYQGNFSPTSLTIDNGGVAMATKMCQTSANRSLMSRIVTVVFVFSVVANVILLRCLVRRKQRQALGQLTEMEPLSSVDVEQQEMWTQRPRRR
ncbi:uncharacterized protein LOC132383139 [Hypanus sabinus]|uniref:uncharacterized protein LOC132383139 n=1 Tax=Hypanus sabinus TaxID=79690 RepID=UPI0028C3834A|nr:uncharacterized protein LOC132383139 [Hypanus sabinus]XP_059809959.1 uncharacterized protein LOC132383139 [Hypanus sabinus]XP_059809960.1 uncharacterized protein LOC132383139 [Hypanus sabinus]